MSDWQSIATAPLEKEVLVGGDGFIGKAIRLTIGWAESADGTFVWEGGSFGGPKPLGFAPDRWRPIDHV